MKTKEAIKFLVMEKGENPSKYYKKYLNGIIELLQRGEKYEKIKEKELIKCDNTKTFT